FRDRGLPLRQLAHHRRNIRPREELGQQLFDLVLGTMGGARQQHIPILVRQVWSEPDDAGEVQPAIAQHGQKDGMPTGGSRGIDAQVGLRLGQVEDLGAYEYIDGEASRAYSRRASTSPM